MQTLTKRQKPKKAPQAEERLIRSAYGLTNIRQEKQRERRNTTKQKSIENTKTKGQKKG